MQPSGRTFGRFLIQTVLIFGFSFLVAFIGATFLLANIGFAIVPIAQLLPAPANDPFWLLWVLVLAMINLLIAGIRYKTGSKL